MSPTHSQFVCLTDAALSVSLSCRRHQEGMHQGQPACQPPVIKAGKLLHKLPTLWCSVTVTDNELIYSSTQTQQNNSKTKQRVYSGIAEGY